MKNSGYILHIRENRKSMGILFHTLAGRNVLENRENSKNHEKSTNENRFYSQTMNLEYLRVENAVRHYLV
jgi:hypothetical protein